jgi:hypothetical protein
MVVRDLLDRVLWRRQDARELRLERFERVRPPEVIRPQEAALHQVLTEPHDLLVAERGGACVLDLDERAIEERVVGGTYDEVIGLSAVLTADARLGQLRQADGEVDVGTGIVGPPALTAILPANLLVLQSAEVESAVEAVGRGEPRRQAAAAAEALELTLELGQGQHRGCHHEERDESGGSRARARGHAFHLLSGNLSGDLSALSALSGVLSGALDSDR